MRDELVSAVVDTNLIVSGLIGTRGNPVALLEAWRAGIFTLCYADEQRAEIEDVLRRPHIATRYGITLETSAAVLYLLETRGRRAPLLDPLPVHPRDRNDEHILAAALAASADYLVTGDKDILVLAGDARLGALQIVTAAVFLDAINAS